MACQTVHIKDAKDCTVAGVIQAGAECATNLSHKQTSMSYEEFVYFLEPQPEQEGIPARGGAICRSAEDYFNAKTALEEACRILQNRCTYEMKLVIEGMQKTLELGKK